MRGRNRARTLAVFALGALLLAGGTAYYLTAYASGTLVILVRDAPADWSRVLVTFSEVRVHRADAANESGWVNLSIREGAIDFLALGNLTKVLAMDRIPAGKYTQIRIVVASVTGTLSGGSSVNLIVPDGILKTEQPFELKPGGTTTITFDFDLAHSIHQAGDQWYFVPVLGSVLVR